MSATPDESRIEATSLLGEPLYRPSLPPDRQQQLDANLAEARRAFDAAPRDEDAIVWLGRRTAYLGRYREAVEIYTHGLEIHPDSYRLLRHRGHRYITLRRFDDAVADLERAAELMTGAPLEIEPDGIPNALNRPLSTTQFNVWYHLGLAHYLRGDFEAALDAYRACLAVSDNPDLLVATTDWMVMTLWRLGRDSEAAALLEPITADLEIVENDGYHQRLLLYKGELEPADLLDPRAIESPGDDPDLALQIATQGYGIGNWYLEQGDEERARQVFQRILDGPSWAAFGSLAAEADLARMR